VDRDILCLREGSRKFEKGYVSQRRYSICRHSSWLSFKLRQFPCEGNSSNIDYSRLAR
jgi:hypothetical protein